jgi:hypothetical protein
MCRVGLPMFEAMTESSSALRRFVVLCLAGGLALAAMIALIAVLSDSFDRTDRLLVETSVGFSILSAMAAAGARGSTRSPWIGKTTVAAAIASFVLLLVVLWSDRAGVAAWRTFGTLAVATLAGSHACLVITGRRATDSSLIDGLVITSLATGTLDSLLAALATTGIVARVDSGFARGLAVLVIVMLLTTLLPPVLRRLPARPPGRSAAQVEPAGQVAELLAVAQRLDQVVPRAGHAGFLIEREAAELRRIVADADR